MAGERKNNVIPEAFWRVVGHSSKEGTIQKLQSSETDQGKLDEFVSKPPELEVMASPLVSEVKSVHDGDSSPEPRPKVKTLEEILADKVNAHLTLYDSSLFLKDQMGGEIQSKILDAFLEYYELGNKGYVYILRKAELVSHTPLAPEELIAQFFPFQEAQRQQWLLATAKDAFLKKRILPQDSLFKIFSKHQNLQKQKDDAERYNIREVEDEEETSLEEKRHSDDSLAVRGGEVAPQASKK